VIISSRDRIPQLFDRCDIDDLMFLSESLPEDDPEGPKHVGVNEHKPESINI
jgi:hypothetical protein